MAGKWYDLGVDPTEEKVMKDREHFWNKEYDKITRSLYDTLTLVGPDGTKYENCIMIPATGWCGCVPELGCGLDPFLLGTFQEPEDVLGEGWGFDPPLESEWVREEYVGEDGFTYVNLRLRDDDETS